MRNILGGRTGNRPSKGVAVSYAPEKVNDPRVVREVLRLLTDGASGKATSILCGLTERQVSRIRVREARKRAQGARRPARRRAKYERPYTPEQRARKRGIMKP